MASLSNRVISIYQRKTSMRLAPAEWDAIKTICNRENITRKKLFEIIDIHRNKEIGFTTSVRLFSIIYYRNSLSNKFNLRKNKPDHNPILEAIKEIV